METNKDKNDEEPPVATTSVEVFIRPLEVTVPADFIYTTTSTTTTTDPNKSDQPQTFWSTMTSRIETETSIRSWSIPPKTETEGNPPGPEDRPSTKEGKEQEGRVIGITPNYKLGEGLPKRELNLGKSGFLPNGTGDYKVSTLQETYKQTFIDPRVVSNANMPHSARIPDARPKIAGDFPSEHSKRSQIKLEPLEQRRFRSTESRPVSTSNYLTESVERHREMEASRLKEFLKAKEGDANQPWNKPGWPGPQKGANDESLRELETIKQKIETLKRTTSQSMNDLRIPTPSQFEQNNLNVPSPISPGESGWLIKMRKDRYLNEASKPNGPKKYKSMDQLNSPRKTEDSSTDDPVHRQLRKEFHLTKYSERRASYHVESTSSYTATSTSVQPPPPPLQSTPIIPPPPAEPPILQSYPPPPAPPPPPPAPVNVQIKRVAANPSAPPTSLEDYPERLMSPPPTHQPRSILKGQQQQQQQQYYSHHSTTTTTLTEQQPNPQLNPQQMHPRPSDRRTPTHFEDLSEEEKTRIMHENLQRHRNMRSGPNGPRPSNASNFNGPFFRLEQVSPQQQQQPRSQSVDPTVHFERHREYHLHQQHHEENLSRMREISASEIELNQHNFKDPSVVVWPPISENERRRPNSVMAKNIQDPERISEYQRQKRLEVEAMARKEQQQMISMTKQIRAMEIQQQRIYEQTHGVVSPIPIIETNQYPNTLSPAYDTSSIHVVPHPPPPPPSIPLLHPQHSHDPPPPQPQNVQIFETRPISAMSDDIPTQQFSGPSWKRTYIVEKPKDVAKNEILTSEELLEKDQYDVDLLKRRETFVEKPETAPHIQRMGRRWQPPPEKPYIWPTNMRRAMSVEPRDFTSPDDDGGDEYKWAPIVVDPGYKREEKNFTPVSSPPASPRRGHGTGPLDEPAKRQMRHVIQPSSDGSHRPKTVFKKERQTPSGGFYPHAPNAIKIVKKRAQSVQGLLSPTDPHVEIIQQRNYHRLDYENGNHQQAKLRRTSHGGSEQDLRNINDLPDWEKIYELPPHSSQIVQKEIPRHVDVQRRLSKFEGSIQNLRAASSQQQLDLNYPMPDYEQQQQQQQQRQRRVRNDSSASYRQQQQQPLPPPPPPLPPQQQMSRRNSVASTRIESPIQPHHQSHHHQHNHRQSRSDSRGMSRAASSIPLSPQPTLTPSIHHSQRPTTPGASRARNYINRATAPSPTPYSYDRARAYVPPALPPGYRLADPLPDIRATSPSPGHTRKMIRNVSESAQRLHPSHHHHTPQTSRAPSRHSPLPTPNRFL